MIWNVRCSLSSHPFHICPWNREVSIIILLLTITFKGVYWLNLAWKVCSFICIFICEDSKQTNKQTNKIKIRSNKPVSILLVTRARTRQSDISVRLIIKTNWSTHYDQSWANQRPSESTKEHRCLQFVSGHVWLLLDLQLFRHGWLSASCFLHERDACAAASCRCWRPPSGDLPSPWLPRPERKLRRTARRRLLEDL